VSGGTPRAGGAKARADAAQDLDAAHKRNGPRTLTEFMACALMMEAEAAQRYEELADAMHTHNNREVAELFTRMAAIERRHAQTIATTMKWQEVPVLPRGLLDWASVSVPEGAASDDAHYLMRPYQALQLALAGEERAEAFFARLAETAESDAVRKAALELRDEEREHVALVKAWMERVAQPLPDWAEDPDPPRYLE